LEENEVFAAIGEDHFRRLIRLFYAQIPADDLLGPMYQGRDLAAAEKRLCDFLIFRFGGPEHYIEQRGHPRLRMRHAPIVIDQTARDRWMQLMQNAMAQMKLPDEPATVLRNFFEGTSTFMINRA
jgi:hemoglobin